MSVIDNHKFHKQGTMEEEYIHCTRCCRKFINDEEHIATDFGYTRWNTRFKNCVDCRNYGKDRKDMITYNTCEYCEVKLERKEGLTTFKQISASELKKENIRNH